MKLNDIPKLMPVPFGVNGPREEIRDESLAGQPFASYSDGFPPITMLMKQAGGLPPQGKDMNQILFELASGQRWSNSGAGYKFNKTFSEAVGGYPKGAQLLSNDGTKVYVSTKDDNKTDFNTSPGNDWVTLGNYIGLGDYAKAEDLKKYLAKDQNGADIQNKDTFIKNLGLKELFLALTGGTLTGPLSIRQDGPAFVILPTTEDGACYVQGRNHNNKAVWFLGNPTDGGTTVYIRNYLGGSEVALHANGVTLNRDTYISGTLELANYSTFDARYSKIRTVLKSDNGYEKDENTGLIRQWGKTPAFGAGNGSPVRFPIPFPSKCVGVSALPIRDGASSAGSAETIYCGAPGLSGVQLFLGGTINYPVYWEAWGY